MAKKGAGALPTLFLFVGWSTAATGAHVGLQPCDLFLRPNEVLAEGLPGL